MQMQQMQRRLDTVIQRLLLVEPESTTNTSQAVSPTDSSKDTGKAERAFSFALLFSGVRCIIMYVILPFVLPIFGIAGTGAQYLDIAINLVAIGAIIYSLRRFWKIDYERKWQYLPVALVALVLLVAFIGLDISELLVA